MKTWFCICADHVVLNLQRSIQRVLNAITSTSTPGFNKVGQVAFLGAMTDIQGAMGSKGATGGPWGHNLKLILDIFE